jgi:hypothetical protein
MISVADFALSELIFLDDDRTISMRKGCFFIVNHLSTSTKVACPVYVCGCRSMRETRLPMVPMEMTDDESSILLVIIMSQKIHFCKDRRRHICYNG